MAFSVYPNFYTTNHAGVDLTYCASLVLPHAVLYLLTLSDLTHYMHNQRQQVYVTGGAIYSAYEGAQGGGQ